MAIQASSDAGQNPAYRPPDPSFQTGFQSGASLHPAPALRVFAQCAQVKINENKSRTLRFARNFKSPEACALTKNPLRMREF